METVRYRTVAKAAQAEFIERKSRFIGSIKPVQTEEDAVAFINEIRSQWRDASHHVYAYILRKEMCIRDRENTERRAGDPPILVGSSEKASKVLGWHPVYGDIHTIVSHAWTWYQKLQRSIRHE